MDISTGLDFAAAPADVYAMMTSQQYQEEVCVASHSLRYAATVSGSSTHTTRTLPSPASAARFTGPELNVVEDIVWGDAAADGSRTGVMTMTVEGQPVTLKGQMRLVPGGRGTTVTLTGELKVAIPLLGKKLEQSSAPAVLAGFNTQQEVGNRWLSR
ncbi:MAG TPA: DUF2505 domain-containing protein [Propionibacteriaceae bacterium]